MATTEHPINKTNLSEDVYNILKTRVQTRILKPGDRLLLREIAEDIGVSLTPVQQAIGRLQVEGLVETLPRRGAIVTGLTEKDIIELLKVRTLIEVQGARNLTKIPNENETIGEFERTLLSMDAVIEGDDYSDYNEFVRLDTDFHRMIVSLAHNNKLIDMYNFLDAQMQVVRFYYARTPKARRVDITAKEHRDIFNAIVEKDSRNAIKVIKKHLTNTEKAVLSDFEII